jgi:hypothetical protein
MNSRDLFYDMSPDCQRAVGWVICALAVNERETGKRLVDILRTGDLWLSGAVRAEYDWGVALMGHPELAQPRAPHWRPTRI